MKISYSLLLTPYSLLLILNSQFRKMNWLDIIIIVLCVGGLIKGLIDGMIKQVVALFALICGIYLCSGVASWLYGYLMQIESFPANAIIPLCFILGFILIVGVVMLAGNIIHRLISVTPLSIINHLIGGIVGLLLMILFISVVINLLEIADVSANLIPPEIRDESRFYYIIKSIIPVFPGDLFQLKNEFFA